MHAPSIKFSSLTQSNHEIPRVGSINLILSAKLDFEIEIIGFFTLTTFQDLSSSMLLGIINIFDYFLGCASYEVS
jgi:hypothetical protein